MNVIPLSQPDISQAEIQSVLELLRHGGLAIGPHQASFEKAVADRSKCSHGIAVASGTAGLHLVLKALDIGPGDEVITTPLSFIASANCILYVGAKPVFADIDPRSLNLVPAQVEAAITEKTRAIIAVELFGNTTHIDHLSQIARQHEISLIEDCAEAIGGRHKGQPVGSFGRCGVFSFYTNKQITTGEGGMIVTDDDRLAQLCRSMRNQGRTCNDEEEADASNSTTHAWLAHERLGYNYRLSELACVLGNSQMQRLDAILDVRRRVAGFYMHKLLDCHDLILPNVDSPNDMSWFTFVVRLSDQYAQSERDRIITGMRRHDIAAANYFPCIHLQPFYRKQFGFDKGDFPVAESIAQRFIALPFFNRMDETQVELVAHTLKIMLQREQLLKRP